MPDFFDISYLSKGSAIQQEGYRAIISSGIIDRLREFNPVVVGTLPLDLFTDKSDIDIICEYQDIEKFQSRFKNSSRKDLNGVESIIATFDHHGFQFEIVAQPIPVTEQFAYRHMIVEWNILAANDEVFRNKILALKKSGIKTEPAFAQLLGLKGDPYQVLLNLTTP